MLRISEKTDWPIIKLLLVVVVLFCIGRWEVNYWSLAAVVVLAIAAVPPLIAAGYGWGKDKGWWGR